MLSSELRRALADIGLSADLVDVSEARNAILGRLALLHPDKTGGEFLNEAQRKSFREAQGVLELIDREEAMENQIIPIQQVSNLIETIAKAKAPTQVEEIGAQQTFRRYLKRKYAFPKITSAIIGSLCFAMLSLLGNFKNSPLYRSAVNLVAFDKVRIINEVNRLGGELKSEEHWLFSIEDPSHWDKENWTSPRDAFVIPVPNRDEPLEEFLIKNTAISDIDIFASDESALFKRLEQANNETKKRISAVITRKQDSLKSPSEAPKRIGPINDPYSNEIYRQQIASIERNKEQLESNIQQLIRVSDVIELFDKKIKAVRDWTLDEKKKALLQAEQKILKLLIIATILAFAVFVWLWVRERSDEAWMEYVSSEAGLESVFLKICNNSEIKTRTPPRFSQSEFTSTLATKEIPRLLGPLLGKKLDSKHLGQIAAAQLSRLRERNIICQSTLPTVQTWYEIRVYDLLHLSEDVV